MQLLESNNFGDADIFDRISDGFFTVDKDWIIKSWNIPAEELLDICAADIIGGNLWSIFDTTVISKFFSEYHRSFAQNVPVYFKEYFRPKDLWFRVAAYPMKDMLLVFFTEHHEHKHNQNFMEFNEDRYQYIFNQAAISIFIWNLSDSRIIEANETATGLLGYDKEDLLSKTIFDFVLKEDYGNIGSFAEAPLPGTEQKKVINLSFLKADRTIIYVRSMISFITYNNKKAVMAVGRDVTDEMRIERERLGANETKDKEITEAVIMALEKQRADIGKILHDDVNQILATVKLLVDVAAQKETNTALLATASAHIKNVINKIGKLSRVLDTAQINDVSFEAAINAMTTDVLKGNDISIKNNFSNLNDIKIGDNLKLNIFRIVEEQLSNVVNYSSADHVNLNIVQDENNISITIDDNGKGYDMNKKRCGLNLSNIYGRCKIYDGRITVRSKPGDGCQIHILFPLDQLHLKNKNKKFKQVC